MKNKKIGTYEEWKAGSLSTSSLKEASRILEEALCSDPCGQGPNQGNGGMGVMVISIADGDENSAVLKSMKSQKKLMELADIVFKIEGIQRVCRRACDEGSEKENEKYEEILTALFELAHMKIDEAKEAFFQTEGEKDIDPEAEPKKEPQVTELPVDTNPMSTTKPEFTTTANIKPEITKTADRADPLTSDNNSRDDSSYIRLR